MSVSRVEEEQAGRTRVAGECAGDRIGGAWECQRGKSYVAPRW